LPREEAVKYIDHRLDLAGAVSPLFSHSARLMIADASFGIPRTINILCDAALTYGYADGTKKIRAHLVAKVISDKEKYGLYSLAKRTVPTSPHISETKQGQSDAGITHGETARMSVDEPEGTGIPLAKREVRPSIESRSELAEMPDPSAITLIPERPRVLENRPTATPRFWHCLPPPVGTAPMAPPRHPQRADANILASSVEGSTEEPLPLENLSRS
jgi:hypothetical protein